MKGKSRIWKRLDEAADAILRIIFIFLVLCGVYAAYDTYMIYSRAGGRGLQQYRPEKAASSEEENSLSGLSDDCVAWLAVDGTDIDYPVMQGEDNSEYLNRDPYGNYALSGSIFLDYRNSADFTDGYNLIYGHHMDYGAMFGALDSFADREYFSAHRSGTLTLADGEACGIRFFAFIETDALQTEIFSPLQTDREAVISYIEKKSVEDPGTIYMEDQDTRGSLIALSTCGDPSSLDRYVLIGTLDGQR